jgi:hypothetical protein
MQNTTSKLAMLQALGPLGDVERERFSKVITQLQANSPEVITGQDGATAGMFVFRDKIPPYRHSFIGLPIFEHIIFVEWPPERSKGAPIANHVFRPSLATPDDEGDWRMPNGDRIIKTRYLYNAIADEQGRIDFNDIRPLALASTGLGFFDKEFASAYPMAINVDGTEIKGPMGCCKWKYGHELHANTRGQAWQKTKYIKGSIYGTRNGPTWDELMRAAELEAEMRKADAVARQQAGIIDAKPHGGPAEMIGATSPRNSSPLQGGAAEPAPRGKITVTTGKMAAYDPGPPTPPLSAYENDNGPRGDPLDIGNDGVDIDPKNRF